MTYQPYFIHGADRPGPWLITCDHATNVVPEAVNGGTLGLPEADMQRHIAYDVGALGVALELARLLDSPAISTNFSRLVIDPNRGEDDPTLLMRLYDGTVIPGNRRADHREREARLDLCYRPYHSALAGLLADPRTVMLSIHSFTARLEGRPARPWELGVLSADDRRLADPLLENLTAITQAPVGDNQPYGGHLPGDAIDRHAIATGRQNTLIELRNDLIRREADQKAWAAKLAPVLHATLDAADSCTNLGQEGRFPQ